MKHLYLTILILCLGTILNAQEGDKWKLFAVTEGVEVYIDTTSIKRVTDKSDKYSYKYSVVSKKIYADSIGKAQYKAKLRDVFARTEKKERKLNKKMKKWDDINYTLIEYTYDCQESCFRTNTITDYNSKGKVIVKTKTPKKALWTPIKGDDVADLMMFYVCDSEQ